MLFDFSSCLLFSQVRVQALALSSLCAGTDIIREPDHVVERPTLGNSLVRCDALWEFLDMWACLIHASFPQSTTSAISCMIHHLFHYLNHPRSH